MSEDALYSEEFETLIHEFCKATSNEVHIREISQFIELFKQSVYLNVLISDPRNSDAIACVTNFLHSRPTLPPVFLSRLIAVASCKIRIAPARFGSSMADSCVATIIPGNVRPPSVMTNITSQTIKELLEADTQKAAPYQANSNNIPSMYKIKMNSTLMDQIVNAQIDYYKIVEEGHRQNGMSVDSYVKTRKVR
uniref:GrBNV_gp75-like protein n=1 Tax=Nilaparvata lugens endogenous nudivirus TaxID=1487700 RepID=X5G6P2_9VIRU|nr:GrBNV_gp75-like protein [Nilaparvata lugens endogenous nudivirus]